ncbi:MAG: hypothetical protein WAZ98_05395 [Cyclobacteriaceae bacterium]
MNTKPPSWHKQWKSKYSGMDVNQLKRVKELEAELAQYKKIVGFDCQS